MAFRDESNAMQKQFGMESSEKAMQERREKEEGREAASIYRAARGKHHSARELRAG